MFRQAVLGVAFMLGVTWFLRHQFNLVIERASARTPANLAARDWKHATRCAMCNGTGRITRQDVTGPAGSSHTEACRTCGGTGWVQNPFAGD